MIVAQIAYYLIHTISDLSRTKIHCILLFLLQTYCLVRAFILSNVLKAFEVKENKFKD